ncbi:MAG: hypothetical protein R6U61_00755 [Thermoplasmata archaeon]
MSKRKKKEEEEPDFEFPEFDRVEYMKDEIKKGKTVLISIAVAPIFSLIATQVFKLTMDWTFGFMVGIFGLLVIFPLFNTLGIDTSDFGKKEYATNAFMFFFTWLAFWLILINPPFNDFTDPDLNDLDIWIETQDGWVHLDDVELNNSQSYYINISAKVTDNVGVKEESVMLEFQGSEYDMERVGDHRYEYRLNLTARTNPYDFTISMEDVNGHTERVVERVLIGEESESTN